MEELSRDNINSIRQRWPSAVFLFLMLRICLLKGMKTNNCTVMNWAPWKFSNLLLKRRWWQDQFYSHGMDQFYSHGMDQFYSHGY